MRNRRPLECPACGHEQLERRRTELRSETGLLRLRTRRWTCRLCSYAWSTSAPATDDDWALA